MLNFEIEMFFFIFLYRFLGMNSLILDFLKIYLREFCYNINVK